MDIERKWDQRSSNGDAGIIFENRILLILKRCSHHEFLADLAQIFKKRLRTSRRINK